MAKLSTFSILFCLFAFFLHENSSNQHGIFINWKMGYSLNCCFRLWKDKTARNSSIRPGNASTNTRVFAKLNVYRTWCYSYFLSCLLLLSQRGTPLRFYFMAVCTNTIFTLTRFSFVALCSETENIMIKLSG